MTGLSRRQALIAAAALPVAPLLGAGPALARAEMLGASQPLFHRFTLGSFEVTALLAETRTTEKPQETFGLNASPEDFAALAEANFLPADRTQNFFTPVVVNTGAELLLFDTGLSAEGTGVALSAAGIAPDQVDIVVLTHMHGDHIGGLTDAAGAPVFANATTSPERRNTTTGPPPGTRASTRTSGRWPRRRPSSTTAAARPGGSPRFRPPAIRRATWPICWNRMASGWS
mgnify:CR=1 FL=1